MSSLLHHTPADILRYLLIDLGEGSDPVGTGTAGWPMYISSEPSSPDQVITIYDTSPKYDGRSMRTGQKCEFSGVQLRVRGIDHQDAAQKARDLADVLDQQISYIIVTIDTVQYVVYAVSRTNGPLNLGNEQGTNRILFTINAVVSLRQVN